MQQIETKNPYGSGVVNNFASIIDHATLEQAKMTARHPLVRTPVALMPDAHLGIGATVGSVVRTVGGLIPAAVGVDLGCGVIAAQTQLRVNDVDLDHVSQHLRENLPAGVGKGRESVHWAWDSFVSHHPLPDLVKRTPKMLNVAASQFGTLGSGNHFAELATDASGKVWALVHSGSRGIGNQIAQHHINIAKELCDGKRPLEHMDLAYFTTEDPQLHNYLSDIAWAQGYAYAQRAAMMDVMMSALGNTGHLSIVNCHHNYTVTETPDVFLTRKGAIYAGAGVSGVIPGSMGADTYIVLGLGNPDSYESSPHGAGRLMARGAAKRTLDINQFKQQMADRGVRWQDRDAQALLDEAPGAYKPIDKVMADAASLVTPVTRLTQFLNFKGL